MTSLDPGTARPRPDLLGFLRTRSRVRVPASPARTPPASASLDLSQAPTSSLDLSRVPAPSASTSLDLSTPAPTAPRRAVAPPVQRRAPRREAPSGRQTLLSAGAPTVTLSLLQSAIGTLRMTAACSPQVGDLRLGCAYSLADGHASTVQHEGGNRTAPPDARSPILQAQHQEFSSIVLDLRHITSVQRLTCYAFSGSHVPLSWGGTMVVKALGETSIEAPLELPGPSPVAVLLALYNVGGRLVIRREMQPFATTPKAACLAYGYDTITWVDDWTPLA